MVEPEWDDDTRAWAEGLADHDRGICHGCGLHTAVIHDPNSHLQIVDDYCPACRALEPYRRKVDDRDRAWEKKNPHAEPGTPRPNDGLQIGLRTATPGEIRRQQAARRRTPPQDTPEQRPQKPRLNRRG